VEVKRLFSTTPEAEIFSKSSWIEMEANGGHWGDRTLDRMRSRYDWTRSVSGSSSQAWVVRVLHQRVRSLMGPTRPVRCQRDSECEGSIGHGGASGHDRPDASSREWVLTGIDRTLALWHPVSSAVCSVDASQAQSLCDRRVRSVE
jgi:hypothetical protein